MGRLLLSALALLLSIGVSGSVSTPAGAQADAATRLRIATLAPTNTRLGQVYRTLDQELRRQTSGRVRSVVYGGGAAGDERVVVRKMRVGQLDGAVLTTTGLGLIVPQVNVLSAPGLVETYEQIDAVRDALEAEFDAMFQRAGYQLIGWGDAGQLRFFSTRRIARPSDLRSARPWVWTDQPLMVESMRQTGATGVALGVPEVLPALQTGMVDTVVASALSAIALQWHTRVRTMSAQASGAVVGAFVLRKDKFDALDADVREAMLRISRDTEGELRNGARELDEDAFEALSRRLELVDAEAHRSEWEEIGRRTREAMVGRLYPRSLLRRVETICAQHPRPDGT